MVRVTTAAKILKKNQKVKRKNAWNGSALPTRKLKEARTSRGRKKGVGIAF